MRKIVLLLAGLGLLLGACKKNLNPRAEGGASGLQNTPGLKTNTGSVDLVYRTQIYAGTGVAGETNGTRLSATFNVPEGVAFDSSGNMFVTDRDNHCIRKITTGGTVSVFAGSTSGVSGFTNGTGTAARFYHPIKLAIDGSNNIYVADRDNNVIRKITSAGVVTTLAGSSSGTAGNTDGTGSAAKFSFPVGIATTSTGTVYVADAHNDRIRKVTSAGVVTTLAGSTAGFADATGTSAKFDDPSGVAIDGSGNVIVADRGNHDIRKVTTSGVVTTIAGDHTRPGLMEGPALKARFDEPYGVCVAPDGAIFITDIGSTNETIRRLNTAGEVFTVGGMGVAGDDNGDFSQFHTPADIAVDASGNLYVADLGNNEIRILSSITTRRLSNTLGWSSTTIATGLTWYKFVDPRNYYYLRWSNAHGLSDTGGRQHINVIDIDMDVYKLVISARADNDSTTVSDMADDITGALAAINGNYSEHSTTDGLGHSTHDSYIRKSGATFYNYLIPSTDTYRWWKHFGAFYYNETTNTTGFLQDSTSSNMYGSFSATTYPNILSGSPMLIKNSVLVGPSAIADTTVKSYNSMINNWPRTCIARNSTTHHILLITVDAHEGHPIGPDAAGTGMNSGDLSQFIHDYFIGYDDALNLDGGGSTTMWIKNYGDRGVVNVPSGIPTATLPYDKQRNALQSALVVVAK